MSKWSQMKQIEVGGSDRLWAGQADICAGQARKDWPVPPPRWRFCQQATTTSSTTLYYSVLSLSLSSTGFVVFLINLTVYYFSDCLYRFSVFQMMPVGLLIEAQGTDSVLSSCIICSPLSLSLSLSLCLSLSLSLSLSSTPPLARDRAHSRLLRSGLRRSVEWFDASCF